MYTVSLRRLIRFVLHETGTQVHRGVHEKWGDSIMEIQLFQEFMRDQQLRVKDNMGFGNVDGFPIYVERRRFKTDMIDIYVNAGDGIWKSVRQEFINMGRSKHCKVICEGEMIKITYRLKAETMRHEFPDLLKKTASILREKGLKPPKNCVICEKDNCDSMAFVGIGNNPIHRQCLQDYLMKVRNKVEDNKRNGSYLIGLVGGIIGMVVGTLPLILAIWMANQLFSVLFVLIPIGTYFGYKLFRGKMNGFVIILAILCSIIGVYFTEIALWCLNLVEVGKLTWEVALEKCFIWLQSVDTWIILTNNATLHFFFAALGIILAWGQISMTNSKKMERIEEVLDTVTQNPSYQEK